MRRVRRLGGALIVPAGALLVGLAGCTPHRTTGQYESLRGAITAVSAQTGELSIRFTPDEGPGRGREQACVVTKDSELYIDDLLSPPAALAVGDTVELVGYRERGVGPERFVISLGYVRRGLNALQTPTPANAAAAKP